MQVRLVIFIFSAVLLVPFIYAVSYIPEVCAAPKDPNWGKTGVCTTWGENDELMECCWEEPDLLNPGETVTWCQTCDSNGKNCGDLYLKKPTTGPFDTSPPGGGALQDPGSSTNKPLGPLGGGVMQDPSTESAPKVPGKGGFSFGPNLKSSQANDSSSNDSSSRMKADKDFLPKDGGAASEIK